MFGSKSRRSCRAGIAWTSLIMLGVVACDNPQPPASCGPLPQVTVNVGESTTVSACFNDPNGDMLTYRATSSNPGVAEASLSGTSVTVRAVAPGNASVAITATDPEGLQGQQSFQVAVPNRAPQPRGTIPSTTVSVGHTETVNASSYFTEPDGETMTYGATSSSPAVATVSVAGSTVTVTGVAKGTSNVTVTAADPAGLSATQTFQSTVPNRGPESVGTIPDQTVELGDTVTVDLSSYFEDPDDDALRYTVTSSDSRVARGSVLGNILTVATVAPGAATLAVTATDTDGASATQGFDMTVLQPNRAPRRVGSIPAQVLARGSTGTIDVSGYFSDPDGDALTYRATSSNSGVVRASVSGSTVTMTAGSIGSATITVTARDPDGLSTTQRVSVTVRSAGAPDLVVPTVTPTAVMGTPGGSVMTTFTIRNRGNATAAATTARIYVSSNSTISTSDTEIGDDPFPSLATGQSRNLRVTVTLSNQASGTFYFGLCLDPVSGESDRQNNCSPGVRVTVESSAACTNDLGTILDGRTVRRTGSWDGSCPSVHYSNGEFARYYSFTLTERLSVTIDLTSSVDTWLALRNGRGTGTGLIESDDDGGTGTNSRIVRTLAPGTYTVEATTLLGRRTGSFTLTLAVGGSGGGADLEFTGGISPRTVATTSGTPFQVQTTLLNSGTARAPATKIRLYLSNNSTITTSDRQLGDPDDLPALAASQRLRITYTITLTGSGSGYLGFCVDSVPGESDTTNNCSASTHVTVRSSSNQNTANIADGVSLVVEEALLRIEPAGGPDHKQELQGLRHMIVGAFSSGGKR